jgi:hypothetical protein
LCANFGVGEFRSLTIFVVTRLEVSYSALGIRMLSIHYYISILLRRPGFSTRIEDGQLLGHSIPFKAIYDRPVESHGPSLVSFPPSHGVYGV